MYKTEYKFDYCNISGYYITKDGHRMFPEDTVKDLKRMKYLEQKLAIIETELKKIYDYKCVQCKDREHKSFCNPVDCRYSEIKKLIESNE